MKLSELMVKIEALSDDATNEECAALLKDCTPEKLAELILSATSLLLGLKVELEYKIQKEGRDVLGHDARMN